MPFAFPRVGSVARVADIGHSILRGNGDTGRPIRVPVQVSPSLTCIVDDLNVTDPCFQATTVTFEPITMAVSDVEATQGLLSGAAQAEALARDYAQRANGVLLSERPTSRLVQTTVGGTVGPPTTYYRYYVATGDSANTLFTASGVTGGTGQTVGELARAQASIGITTGTTGYGYGGGGTVTGVTNITTNANYLFYGGATPVYGAAGGTVYGGGGGGVYGGGGSGIYGGGGTGVFTAPQLTPEQQAAFEAADAARQAKWQVVSKKAEQLWLSHLTDAQRQQWLDVGYVDVPSARGRRYRLKNQRSGNVYLLDDQGREVRKYCAYANDPGGYLPDGDHWFTQLLTLRFNERAFLAMANTWDLLTTGNPFVGQGADA